MNIIVVHALAKSTSTSFTTRFKSVRELPLLVPSAVVGNTIGPSTNDRETCSITLVFSVTCPIPQAVLGLHPEVALEHGDTVHGVLDLGIGVEIGQKLPLVLGIQLVGGAKDLI